MTKVVVTGIGLVTPLGQNKATTWQNLLDGKSGVNLTSIPELKNIKVPVARIDTLENYSSVPRVQQFMQQAVTEAIADANLDLPLSDAAVIIGSSRAYQQEIEEILQSQSMSNVAQTKLKNWLNFLPSHLSTSIAQQVRSENVVLAPMAACATANWAIAQAYELIQTHQCSLAIVGASDTPITPLGITGFQQLGAMCKTGIYPFSREREGLGLGEGAAALILESDEHRQARGCQPFYGQVLGFGLTNDAIHITSPSSNYSSAKTAIQLCLKQAQLGEIDVDCINVHGTATAQNDILEAKLIKNLFPQRPSVVATKGATGHALGATGMMEAAFCLLSLQSQILPSCINMQSPAFNLNFVRSARSDSINVALNFSFGFGGQNAIIAFGNK